MLLCDASWYHPTTDATNRPASHQHHQTLYVLFYDQRRLESWAIRSGDGWVTVQREATADGLLDNGALCRTGGVHRLCACRVAKDDVHAGYARGCASHRNVAGSMYP